MVYNNKIDPSCLETGLHVRADLIEEGSSFGHQGRSAGMQGAVKWFI
jgi:hypothetical protein